MFYGCNVTEIEQNQQLTWACSVFKFEKKIEKKMEFGYFEDLDDICLLCILALAFKIKKYKNMHTQ